jgi:uncharacterized protein (TIGR00725 family)
MEAAARGAKTEGGTTVGILPGTDASEANAFIDIPIPTGMGEARNVINVRAADAVIAVRGRHGTLSEIAHAIKMGTHVVAVAAWTDIEGIAHVDSPEEAVALAFDIASGR